MAEKQRSFLSRLFFQDPVQTVQGRDDDVYISDYPQTPVPEKAAIPEPKPFCGKCGTKNDGLGKFCIKCGSSLL